MIAENLALSLTFFCYIAPNFFDRGLFKSSFDLGCKSHVVDVCTTLQDGDLILTSLPGHRYTVGLFCACNGVYTLQCQSELAELVQGLFLIVYLSF